MPDEQSGITGDRSPPIGGEGGDATSGAPDGGGPAAAAGTGWFSPLRIGIAVVLVAAALIAWQSTGGSSPLYRTATVGTGTVEATLDSVGTITPANQASLNFNVSGTVSAVDVSVGQTVTAGQTLASLNIADLNAAVVSAQATLAAAQATLASAEASQTEAEEVSSTSASTPTSSSVATSSTTTTTAPPSGAPSSSGGKVTQLEATLTSDQTQLDADSSQAGSTIAQATTLCAAQTPAATPSTPTTTPITTTTDPSPDGGAPSTCAEALTQASAAQAAVAADIKTVTQDESALTSVLEASSGSGAGSSSSGSSGTGKTGTTSSGTAPTSSGTATTSSGTAGTGSGASTGGSGTKASKVATPQQLAVDQASIDTAAANLSDAQQALSGVNLVSTISGTVASVSIEDGDSVTAGSSSSPAQIVVIGTGTSYDLSTDIGVADIGEVAIGQQVQVTPDATNTVVDGRVSSIGVLASSGSTATTYPVTISLEAADLGQLSGADANLSIIVKKSVDVTTVPSSAVRTVGSIHLVIVVHGNTAKSVRVTLGTVGDVLTQVTSGVSTGQSVALADLNQPLPSTSTATTRTGFGGGELGGAGLGDGGGFGGGGRFGG